jgi:hypothetical protein
MMNSRYVVLEAPSTTTLVKIVNTYVADAFKWQPCGGLVVVTYSIGPPVYLQALQVESNPTATSVV